MCFSSPCLFLSMDTSISQCQEIMLWQQIRSAVGKATANNLAYELCSTGWLQNRSSQFLLLILILNHFPSNLKVVSWCWTSHFLFSNYLPPCGHPDQNCLDWSVKHKLNGLWQQYYNLYFLERDVCSDCVCEWLWYLLCVCIMPNCVLYLKVLILHNMHLVSIRFMTIHIMELYM